MTRRSLILASIALAALVAPCAAAPAPPDAPQLLERLQAWLDGTRDLEARFEQQMLSGAFGTGGLETGRLWVARPGRMRWEYEGAEPKLALVDGDRTWFYVEQDRQLTLGRLDADTELLPALLAGDARLSTIFRASLDAGAAGAGPETFRLRLAPVRATDAFEELLVTVRAPEFAIAAVEVQDAAGNRVVYRFAKLRRNRGVDTGLFRFEPPPGTDIQGGHGT